MPARRRVWAPLVAEHLEHRVADRPTVRRSALDFTVALRTDDDELADAVDALFCDLDDVAAPTHIVTLARRGSGGRSLWADGVLVAAHVPHGSELSMVSWLVSQGTIRHPGDHLLFHAAVLSAGGDGLLLPAMSGAGKSTLAAALVARGLDYLSDEVAALHAPSGHLVGFPKPISLDSASVALLSGHFDHLDHRFAPWMSNEWQVPASVIREGSATRRCTPRLVVFPVRALGEPASLRRLRPTEVLARLVEHSFNFAYDPATHFDGCAELSRAVEGYELVGGDLAAAVDLLLGLLGIPRPTDTLWT